MCVLTLAAFGCTSETDNGGAAEFNNTARADASDAPDTHQVTFTGYACTDDCSGHEMLQVGKGGQEINEGLSSSGAVII